MTDKVRETDGPHNVFEFVNQGLDDLRRRVDEILVRLDVGEMNVRGEAHTDLDRAVNMALLVKSRLHHRVHDLGSRFGGDHTRPAETTGTNGESRARHVRHVRHARPEEAKG